MRYDCTSLLGVPVSSVGLHTGCIGRIFGLELEALHSGTSFRGGNVTEGCGDGITTSLVARNS